MNGVNIHRFRSYVNVGHFGFFPGFIGPLTNGGFDIVHAHGYRQPQSEMGSRIAKALSIPAILHVHGGFHSHSRLKRRLYQSYDKLARKHKVNKFAHFIALSENDRQNIKELNVDGSMISIIRNSTDNQAFDRIKSAEFKRKWDLDGRKVILYLGILHRYKRPDLLIRALPEIIKKVPKVFILFVGPDAGELKGMQEIGEALGVTKNYKWIGPLHGREKHEAIECSEFLALPSDEDPYPLVLIEAMAHGKPVLTTDVVGQAGVIAANETGIIIRPGDLKEIEEGAVRLLTDEVYKNATGANARRLAEAYFHPQSVVNEIETLYAHLKKGN